MSGGLDAELRRLERAALLAPEDAAAVARFVAAHLRAGGRDPRRDPRKGDVVRAAAGSYDPTRSRWPSGYKPRTWEVTLPERGPSRFVSRERVTRRTKHTCPACSGAGIDGGVDFEGRPRLAATNPCPGCRGTGSVTASHGIYRSSVTLASWRRWAAGGTVLAIGPTLPALDAVGLMLALRETLTVAVRAVGARLAREVAHHATAHQSIAGSPPNWRNGSAEHALQEAAHAAAVALGAGVVHLRVDALLREIAVDEVDRLAGLGITTHPGSINDLRAAQGLRAVDEDGVVVP